MSNLNNRSALHPRWTFAPLRPLQAFEQCIIAIFDPNSRDSGNDYDPYDTGIPGFGFGQGGFGQGGFGGGTASTGTSLEGVADFDDFARKPKEVGDAPAPAQKPAPRPAPQSAGSGFDDLDNGDIPFRDPLSYRGAHLVL